MTDNAELKNRILLCTINDVPGKKIVKVLGLVSGNTVQSRHIGVDFLAGLKQLIGGEIKGYTKMVQNARHEATQRMIDEARALGANAILCVRYTSTEAMQNSSEVFAFGTAVVLK